MDTSEVAQKLGITPRTLRQFLRSPMSTFVAVGSGARYDFNDRDLAMIEKRFFEWQGAGKPRPDDGKKTKPESKVKPRPKAEIQREEDEAVWAEEKDVKLEDIRDPRVRARVKRDARRAEDRLTMMLMARGMHISQLGDRKVS